jgi:RNA polymerase sigma-70 factor (ECF subfamily)
MDRDPAAALSPAIVDPRFETVWRKDRGRMVALARRMLGDRAEAEDVVQEAFGRLARVDLDELDDVQGWLAVVVRRLCLDRIRSARFRHEAVTLGSLPDGVISLPPELAPDPADRITLDDQVQLALAVLLDRLSPAERTAFVLHDIFGFPYAAVGEIVGRSTTACRQLASRARRSVREGPNEHHQDVRPADIENEQHRAVSERFIAACAGGDITALMEVLDPHVVGEATVFGFGSLLASAGRPTIAQRLLGLFGPGTDTALIPIEVEHQAGVIAFAHRRVAAVVRFETEAGLIRDIHALVLPPGTDSGTRSQ